MILGIVGHEAAKFTEWTEKQARLTINRLLDQYRPNRVISGGCHLGGIDIWAVEEAKNRAIATTEYLPKTQRWEGGYKDRNILIATSSDVVACIVVAEYPQTYTGMRFDYCYHCKSTDHIKSGGCWTMKYAEKLGKKTCLYRIL